MADYELKQEGFQTLLGTIDNTVLGLPQAVQDALTAGEELAAALAHSSCAKPLSRVVDVVLRADLPHLTVGCENVAGAGHRVRKAPLQGDEDMAEDAINQGVQ